MFRESTEFSKQEIHGGLERNSNRIFEVMEKSEQDDEPEQDSN